MKKSILCIAIVTVLLILTLWLILSGNPQKNNKALQTTDPNGLVHTIEGEWIEFGTINPEEVNGKNISGKLQATYIHEKG